MRAVSLLLSILLCSLPVMAFTPAIDEIEALHLDWLDKNVKPETDFFKFANGNWVKNNPIPSAYARWGTFNILEERNQEGIKSILEAESKRTSKLGTETQKIGDFYFGGMDEASINKNGITPLQSEFELIMNIKNSDDLQKEIAHLQLIGVDAPFAFTQMQDYTDSTKVIGIAFQAGLGLPDRDYYLKNEENFQTLRQKYLQHIVNMFVLLGDSLEQSTHEAQTVMNIETQLAKASFSRIEQRDPHNIYHIMSLEELKKVTPHFDWKKYFSDLGYPQIQSINLAVPEFFKAFDAQLMNISLTDWKVYLRWHLVDEYAPYLSDPFVNENFSMKSAINGSQELLPRWKRVIAAEDRILGFAVGKLYVKKDFPASSKQKTQEILTDIRHSLEKDLNTASWMTPQTRKAALEKLNMMGERIGYPDNGTWRDYSTLKIDRGSYVLNIKRGNEFLKQYELNKIGKPVDRSEWEMTPQTVNAYYDPSTNRINIPAGILQPPFFDPKAPASVNYGAIGFIIGHEITHGFDDQGARFDGYGNLRNWWGEQDLQQFKTKIQAIAEQFSQYKVAGMNIQGQLITGEAAADLGGLTLAYQAFHASIAYKQGAKLIAGYTPDQQFFLGAAHVWAGKTRKDEARLRILTDPHPPAKYRVNGTVANMLEFQQAFTISPDSPMINKNRITIW